MAAVEQYSGSNLPPLFLEKPLRMRVCRSGTTAKEDHPTQARKRGREEVPCDAKSWEGLPLPGHCARYPHLCCAYYCRSPIHDSVNGSDATSISSVLGVAVAACVSLGMTGDGKVEQEVAVVVFSSEWDREKAVEEHGLARCGPPVLEDLLTRPRSLEEHWSRHAVIQSQMNAVPDISQKLAHLCDNGFKLLGPSEALEEVRELLDGHGRIAVKDKMGSLAVLRVPTYVASLE